MADSRDITGKNRKFTGTTGIKLPSGTTGQRVDETGQIRFNSTTNLAEYYNGVDWKPIDAPPTITGFTLDGGSSVTTVELDEDAAGDASIVITGSNFDDTAGTVTFVPDSGGTAVNTQTITRTSSSSFTVTVTRGDFVQGSSPYGIVLTNGSGLAATLSGAITLANEPPTFATAADTNIGTVRNSQTDFSGLTTVAATDPDGDTITHTISSGTLPNGMSLATNGTFTGTASSLPTSVTNYTFTVQAATTFSNSTRQFVISAIDSLNINASGGTETTSGDYKIHTFTSGGTFTVSKAGIAPEPSVVDYLVIAGGGGGGGPPCGTHGGGGGGAGGYRESHSDPVSGPYTASPLATPTGITVTATAYPIVVGGGGGGGNPASPGNASSFSTITSAGGGKGNIYNNQGGIPGGSGGGGGVDPGSTRGNGNVPPVSPPQGQPSGIGPVGWAGGSGGGGAGAAGSDGQSSGGSGGSHGGRGGNGVTTSITGSPVTRAGGGGAASRSDAPFGPGVPGSGGNGTGGSGGGGSAPSQNGGTNTGGGAGGGRPGGGGTGGSGLVVIRYKYQ